MNRHQRRAQAKQQKNVAVTPVADPRALALLQAGVAHQTAGRLPDAERCYREILSFDPNQADALHLLGLIAHQQRRCDVAYELIQLSIRHRGPNGLYLANLGAVLRDWGKAKEAVPVLQEALRLRPDNAETYCNLGASLRDLGRLEEAAAAQRRAIALKPDYETAYGNLGSVLIQLGHMDEARAALEQAIRIAPRSIRNHRYLAEIDGYTANGGERLRILLDLAGSIDTLPLEERIHLHFALGKACDELGRHADAFKHLQAGNALKRAHAQYDEGATLGAIRRIQEVYTREHIDTAAGRGHPSDVPIFVVGMPRSGTTLMEQMLASHPQVHGGGELKLLEMAMNSVRLNNGGLATFPECVVDLRGTEFHDVAACYLQEVGKLAPPSAKRIVDKMTMNFRMLGAIHLALPNAKIIHVVRDPIDTCLSCFSKLFIENQSYTNDLGELGRYYATYRRLMQHWREVLPEGRILDVHYENMVATFESEARRIIAHCGLDWDDRCLTFYKTKRPVMTASATQVRRPIYDTAVGRARAYGPFLGPLISELH